MREELDFHSEARNTAAVADTLGAASSVWAPAV
jgi:predicted unusual protein kinase regulating ubiquinone biosynthesis (AarF/ABC1/UbiB family)